MSARALPQLNWCVYIYIDVIDWNSIISMNIYIYIYIFIDIIKFQSMLSALW